MQVAEGRRSVGAARGGRHGAQGTQPDGSLCHCLLAHLFMPGHIDSKLTTRAMITTEHLLSTYCIPGTPLSPILRLFCLAHIARL